MHNPKPKLKSKDDSDITSGYGKIIVLDIDGTLG